ncbi:MAG: filamentous hemagglutinin N-terminal domain-containing protein, partial [Gammaproteobacteria bacterium]|nr:filamentous hemagglutinin N-terminal domain-containing protein [Gammaproteobacteria bacterium]
GTLSANGNVILLNAAGMFFSPTAMVNVNSLIASSLDLSDEDFFAGRYKFQAAPHTEGGLVVNQGTIEAAIGGSVSLIGGAVSNEGVILAQAGQVNLVSGN